MTINKATQKVKDLLVNITKFELEGTSDIAIPFSGSLDSSLIAHLVHKYTNAKIQLYTIGFPNCYDFKQSKSAAQLLNLAVKYITLDNKILQKNLKEYLKLTNDKNKVSISYTLPFYILLQKIKEKTVITGHGADTLFGGFHKYLKSSRSKLKSYIKQCYLEFLDKLPDREYKIAEKFHKNLILPFENKELADFVLTLPENYFIRNGQRKYLLRQVAKAEGLPQELVIQPKKALQYSSGMMKKLRKIWKKCRGTRSCAPT
jgi:asparagine synthase (glutamine-hydrolysing)